MLSVDQLAAHLGVRDLTDRRAGRHALQLLVEDIAAALSQAWGCDVRMVRTHPLVTVEDNYDRLGFSPDAVTRDTRYSHYVSETCMLRTHTSAMVPPVLRDLASAPPSDLLIVCPGMVYRRDAIDRLHTGHPHQLDLWRIASRPLGEDALQEMMAVVAAAALPGVPYRATAATHPYTVRGRQIDAFSGGAWVEIGECGLAAPAVLARAGLESTAVHGLAMGLGLDRLLMLRKDVPDIRLLRAADPRVAGQMQDLEPYRPASSRPAIERDLSVAVAAGTTAEALGDRVRDVLGEDAGSVEAIVVLSETPAGQLPPAAIERLGLGEGQKNMLLRVVLRNLDRTLVRAEANVLRDRIYAALHEGGRHQWASRQG